MAGQVVVLEDAQPCRSGQALRPDWQCGRGAGWGAQACQPQTGDLDLHCLAQDVHPLLGRPASPRLPGPVHLRVSIEWRWWRSWWCWWKPSLHRSADIGGTDTLPGKSGPTPTAEHQTCACFALRQLRAHFPGRCFVVRANLLHISWNGKAGGCRGAALQQGQGDCKLQLTGKQNMDGAAALSLTS